MTAISANTVIFSYNTNTINTTVSKYLKLVIVINHSIAYYQTSNIKFYVLRSSCCSDLKKL